MVNYTLWFICSVQKNKMAEINCKLVKSIEKHCEQRNGIPLFNYQPTNLQEKTKNWLQRLVMCISIPFWAPILSITFDNIRYLFTISCGHFLTLFTLFHFFISLLIPTHYMMAKSQSHFLKLFHHLSFYFEIS